MKLILLVLSLSLCGCVHTKVVSPTGWTLERTALMNKTQADLEVPVDGGTLRIKGYRNDGTEALGIIVESAVKAGIKGAKGGL